MYIIREIEAYFIGFCEIQPAFQKKLTYGLINCACLRESSRFGFTLCGGTAIALQLGHAASASPDDLMATELKVILH